MTTPTAATKGWLLAWTYDTRELNDIPVQLAPPQSMQASPDAFFSEEVDLTPELSHN